MFRFGKNEELGDESFDTIVVDDKVKLGKGAYGTVCSGLWKEQPIAIKKINLGCALPGQLDNIKQETKIHASLKHDNIVQFIGASKRADNCLYLFLELMEFGNLYDILYNHYIPLNTQEYLTITKDLVKGLAYLHGQSVLHRDLKPENVLLNILNPLNSHNHQIQAKIADFGLAIKKEDARTVKFSGSLLYIAPELAEAVLKVLPKSEARHYNYSELTDIYALGIILLEMMLREPPYEKDKPSLQDIARGMHTKIPEKTPLVIADIIAGCLNKEPSKRLDTKGITELLARESTVFKPIITISKLYDSLYRNIKNGNLKAIQILIKLNKNLLNHLNNDGYTPLHLAAFFGKKEIVDYLIGEGAKVNISTPEAIDKHKNLRHPKMTALDIVLLTGKEDDLIATALINAGGRTSPTAHIHYAAKNGQLDTIKKLLAADPTLVHAKDTKCQTALLWAAARGHTETVRYLITQNADVNVATQLSVDNRDEPDHNKSALDWAIKGKHTATIAILKTAGAIANKRAAEAKIEPASAKNSYMFFNGANIPKTVRYDASFVPALVRLPVYVPSQNENSSFSL